ncbi:hypothetical protein KY285_013176 [Solanum tuberosum]|nr:hypothetical protein KY285_013176 [Solanum tuberosum]
MAGAVLCTLNMCLNSSMISTLLIHSEAKIIFVDQQFIQLAQEAIYILASKNKKTKPPLLVVIISEKSNKSIPYTYEYENGHTDFAIRWPITEFDPISIDYTSGTTSRPKGVVFSHRGAYLNSIATFLVHEMSTLPIYLWTLPTFHCNGWCMIWGLAAVGGTNVCLRSVSPKEIFESISLYKVTHMSGAPTVLNMIVNTPSCDRKPLPHKVKIATGGSPPPPQIISRMEEMGYEVNHIYGLTETYGPDERFILKATQGVQHLCVEEVDIRDSITMKKVPADGVTMGEVMFRGNTERSKSNR